MNREFKRAQAREEKRAARQEDKMREQRQELFEKRRRTSPGEFLKEVRGELKKVAWPNRREVTSYTLVVLITTTVLTLIVWGMDFVMKDIVLRLFG